MWSEAIILFKLQFKNKILCTVIIVLHLETLAVTYCIHSLYPALRELHHLLSCSLSLLLQTSQKHLERAAGCSQSWHIWVVFKVKSLYLLLGEERGLIIKGNKWDAWQLMIQRDGSHACQALTSLRRKRLQNEKSGWFIFLVTMRWPLEDLEAQKWASRHCYPWTSQSRLKRNSLAFTLHTELKYHEMLAGVLEGGHPSLGQVPTAAVTQKIGVRSSSTFGKEGEQWKGRSTDRMDL